jgi:hypothetical protein
MPVNELTQFACGLLGSVSVELLYVLKVYQSGRSYPSRYRKSGFWVVRTALALIAGILSCLYDPPSLILALHIGASTPLLIAAFAQSPPVVVELPSSDS